MKISTRLLYAPFVLLYFSGIITHDVLPNLSNLDVRWIGYLMLFFIIGVAAILPGVMIVLSVEMRKVEINAGLCMRFALGTCAFFISYFYFWNDWSSFYISLVISIYISLIGMIILRKDCRKQQAILRDKMSGDLYKIRAGKAYRLSDDEAKKYQSNNIPAYDFSSGSLSGSDSNFTVIPLSSVSDGSASNDYNTGIAINPSSGMPMVGGISGMDVHGNSWGTNFNEPSNTYDPNRGY